MTRRLAGVAVPPASRNAPIGLILLRLATWSWLFAVLAIGTAGMAAAYRDPSLIRIEELSAVYENLGLSDRIMMTALLVLPLLFSLLSGAVIAVRRPNDEGALLLAMCMVGLYFFTSGAYAAIEAKWLRDGSASLAVVLIAVFLVAFPTGTIRPRWSVIAPLAAVVIAITRRSMAADTRLFLTEWQAFEVPFAAWGGWSIILVVAAIGQVTRYRKVSTEVERAQARWVMLGAFGILIAPGALLVLNALGRGSPTLTGSAAILSSVGSYLLPVTLMIAVFRHHLYDIDRIVSRTVTYSLVAIVVTAAFVIPVLALGAVVGESNDLVVAGSTLLAAAAFAPARRRIHRSVERRFNRTAYDFEHEVDSLSGRLRSDVTFDAVEGAIHDVVTRTLQPARVGLWIRERP